MCVMSMAGDHFGQRIPEKFPWINPGTGGVPLGPQQPIDWTIYFKPQPPSREEFDKLKAEVEHMKELLVKAKIYDEVNGEKDCEIQDKIEKLKAIAAIVGISLDDIFIGEAKKAS